MKLINKEPFVRSEAMASMASKHKREQKRAKPRPGVTSPVIRYIFSCYKLLSR
jgi:hypothetical protein